MSGEGTRTPASRKTSGTAEPKLGRTHATAVHPEQRGGVLHCPVRMTYEDVIDAQPSHLPMAEDRLGLHATTTQLGHPPAREVFAVPMMLAQDLRDAAPLLTRERLSPVANTRPIESRRLRVPPQVGHVRRAQRPQQDPENLLGVLPVAFAAEQLKSESNPAHRTHLSRGIQDALHLPASSRGGRFSDSV